MPKLWKSNVNESTNSSQPIDLKEVNKWQINDMKETKESWAKQDAIKKEQIEKQISVGSSFTK